MDNHGRLTADRVEDLVWMMEGVEFAEAREIPSIGGFDPFIVLKVQFGDREHRFELHDSITSRELLTLVQVIAGSKSKARKNIERFDNEDW